MELDALADEVSVLGETTIHVHLNDNARLNHNALLFPRALA